MIDVDGQPTILVLGPVEVVRSQGTRLRLSGLETNLLALLAVNAGQVVSAERIVDDLWPDDPPASARNRVQSLISAVRGRLGDRAHLVVTRPPGYLLRPGVCDVDCLESALKLAREAKTALGDLTKAKEWYETALSYWRGVAYDGVTSPLVTAEATRLEEHRRGVREELVDIRLTLGDDLGLVSELTGLVAGDPLRERLRGQLMIALFRIGRQAQALEVYRQGALALATEHGLDPGEDLQRLHRAILTSDPALRTTTSIPAPPLDPVPTPAQLPADVSAFTGRAGELAQLDQLSTAGAGTSPVVILAIGGMAGVGKTALALHWAHRARNDFPDGQLYVNLHGFSEIAPLRPIDALNRFLHALGVAPSQVPANDEEAAALYRTLLAERRMLVFLDNARDAAQVRPLLPGGAPCLVLVTSRNNLSGLVARDGAQGMRLGVLTTHEASRLLRRLLGAARADAEPGAVAELAELCAYLPLALRIAAANVVNRPYQTVADYVRDLSTGDPIRVLDADGDDQAAVRAIFGRSMAALPLAQQRLFQLLGVAPGEDFTAETAAALAGITIEAASTLLDGLVNAHLVDRHRNGRFGMHDLLCRYAAEQSRQEPDSPQALHRLCEFYFGQVSLAADVLYPELLRLPDSGPSIDPPTMSSTAAQAAQPPTAAQAAQSPTVTQQLTVIHAAQPLTAAQAANWLDAERANLVAAATFAAERDLWPVAWLLADALRGYFHQRSHLGDGFAVALAGLSAAQRAGERRAEAAMRLALSVLHWRQVDNEEALRHLTAAIQLARESDWPQCEASILNNIGVGYLELGQMQAAVDYFRESLDINRRIGAVAGQATNLTNLGAASLMFGNLHEAAAHSEAAHALYAGLQSVNGQADALTSLGETQHLLGFANLALAQLDRAAQLRLQQGDIGNQIRPLCALAAAHADLGQHRKAHDLTRTAVDLAHQSTERRPALIAYTTLGLLCGQLGDDPGALHHYGRAVDMAREAHEPYWAARALVGQATALHRLGAQDAAQTLIHEAIAVTRVHGYRIVEANALTCLAAIDLAVDRVNEAIEHAGLACVIHRGTGHRLGEAHSLVALGNALARNQHTDAAMSHWREALSRYTSLGSPESARVQGLLS